MTLTEYRPMNITDTYTLNHVVAETETAESVGSGGLPVYSTPAMIALMEKTAYKFLNAEGLQSVGTRVEISHLRACKPGTELTATAELVQNEGRKYVFNVKVSDNNGVIGEGSHDRFVIDPERFMSKLG
jgi:predicted thioesterase